MSKQLQRLADTDPRFEEYSDETFGIRVPRGEDASACHDGHWLYMAPGWKWDGDKFASLHQIHEWTVKDVLAEVPNVVPCDCESCAAAKRAGEIRHPEAERMK